MLKLLRILFHSLAGLAFDPGRRRLLRCPPPSKHHAPSPACISTTEFRSVWQTIQPTPPHPPKSFFPLLKAHLSFDWGGFSIEPWHVKDFQNRSKWCLDGAFLALNGPCRQCSCYLPKFPLCCSTGCFCVYMFVRSVVANCH